MSQDPYIEPECIPAEEQVDVPIIIDGHLLITLTLAAHAQGITLNELCIRILREEIEKDKEGKAKD